VGCASTDDDATDNRAAVVTRFVSATKHTDKVLLLALRTVDIGVVAERCAAMGDSVLEDLANGLAQQPSFGRAQRAGRRFGIERREEEGCIGVDIADASDIAWVEQRRLDRLLATPPPLPEAIGRGVV